MLPDLDCFIELGREILLQVFNITGVTGGMWVLDFGRVYTRGGLVGEIGWDAVI